VALFYGREIATGLLPLLRWEIAQLTPHYEIRDLSVAHASGETAITVSVKTAYPRLYDGRYLPADVPMRSSTLLGHLLQPLVVMLSLISTAALLRRQRALPLVLFAIPAAVAVVMLDVPFVLVGALEDLVLSTGLSSDAYRSPWVTWMNLLNGGGRLALGIGAALVVIAIAPGITASADRRVGLQSRTPRISSKSGKRPLMTSSPRRRGPGQSRCFWIPACAGMTTWRLVQRFSKGRSCP
jgi:hypothetical protein